MRNPDPQPLPEQSIIDPPRRNGDPPAGVVGGEAAGAGPLPGQAAGPGATAPPRGQQGEGKSINNSFGQSCLPEPEPNLRIAAPAPFYLPQTWRNFIEKNHRAGAERNIFGSATLVGGIVKILL